MSDDEDLRAPGAFARHVMGEARSALEGRLAPDDPSVLPAIPFEVAISRARRRRLEERVREWLGDAIGPLGCWQVLAWRAVVLDQRISVSLARPEESESPVLGVELETGERGA